MTHGRWDLVAFFTSFVLSVSIVCLSLQRLCPRTAGSTAGLHVHNGMYSRPALGQANALHGTPPGMRDQGRRQPKLGITGTSTPAHRCSNPALQCQCNNQTPVALPVNSCTPCRSGRLEPSSRLRIPAPRNCAGRRLELGRSRPIALSRAGRMKEQ